MILGNKISFGAWYTQGTFVCRWGGGEHPHADYGGLGHGCGSFWRLPEIRDHSKRPLHTTVAEYARKI